MDNVFDVDRILLLSSDLAHNIYSSLEKYVNLAKKSGNFRTQYRIYSKADQYKVMVDRIQEIAPNFVVKARTQ